MGEPLSPYPVFDFPIDEPEPHPAYEFFAPESLPGYAGNPNNNNGWIKVDVPLLGELGAEADEPMVGPLVGEIAELMVEMEEQEWLMVPVTPPPMPDVPPPNTYKVGGPFTAAAEGQSFTLLTPGLPVPLSVIEDLITHMGNLEYGHGQLVKKVIQVSDAEVADGITIREIGPRVSVVEGQVQVMASQMVQAVRRLEQVGTQVKQGQQTTTQRDEVITELTQQVQALQAAVQQRDLQIQQVQTMVSEMSSCESTLMQ
ncbi:hypothetical protein Tco_0450301 [Tanacetum coccineum]